MAQQFFYDGQIRRFLEQITRMFSGFQVEYGRNQAGQSGDTLVRVPVRYGDASRQAQTIIQQNSANMMPSTPLMTFYISDLSYDRPRIQNPTFVSNTSVRQRTYDEVSGSWETAQGNAFTVERFMPAPYKMTIKLDIWTSNTNQKLQILEQILPLFNPALEVQSTDSYLDWTSLSVVEVENTAWSSRSIPVGTEDPIDIGTITFSVPIWLSLPAKVKKLGVVERIVASIYDAKGDAANALMDNDLLLGTRQVFTPFGYQVLLLNNQLQVLRQPQVVDEPNASVNIPSSPDSNLLWQSVIGMYGTLRPGISMIALEQENGTEVMGTVAYNPTDDRFMMYTVDVDTIPVNTLEPVNAIIDPQRSGPGAGLPPAALGQRYLITEDMGDWSPEMALAWQGPGHLPIAAVANDIIEYDGTKWIVAFNSRSDTFPPNPPVPYGEPPVINPNNQYCTNITTSVQYVWNGEMWQKSYQGLYPGGRWRLIL